MMSIALHATPAKETTQIASIRGANTTHPHMWRNAHMQPVVIHIQREPQQYMRLHLWPYTTTHTINIVNEIQSSLLPSEWNQKLARELLTGKKKPRGKQFGRILLNLHCNAMRDNTHRYYENAPQCNTTTVQPPTYHINVITWLMHSNELYFSLFGLGSLWL